MWKVCGGSSVEDWAVEQRVLGGCIWGWVLSELL